MTMSERSEDNTNVVRSLNVIVKESSQVNTSSRIYYYGGASVPFLWETRPGTPKHPRFSESFHLPPLTPPPSYFSSSLSSGNKLSKARTKQTRSVKTLFNAKHHVSCPSFSWSSTTSSSSSSMSSSHRSKTVYPANKCFLFCSRSYVKDDDEEEIGSSSPTSTLYYKRGFSSSMGSMKRALSSVLSNRSSRNDLRLI